MEAVVVDFPNYAMIITIYIGFGTMILAFLYFERELAILCMKRCKNKLCDKKSPVVNGSQEKIAANGDHKLISNQEEPDERLDENLQYNLDRLTSKISKNKLEFEPQAGFDDYASNKQNWCLLHVTTSLYS